jgi:hypothetical protein
MIYPQASVLQDSAPEASHQLWSINFRLHTYFGLIRCVVAIIYFASAMVTERLLLLRWHRRDRITPTRSAFETNGPTNSHQFSLNDLGRTLEAPRTTAASA